MVTSRPQQARQEYVRCVQCCGRQKARNGSNGIGGDFLLETKCGLMATIPKHRPSLPEALDVGPSMTTGWKSRPRHKDTRVVTVQEERTWLGHLGQQHVSCIRSKSPLRGVRLRSRVTHT